MDQITELLRAWSNGDEHALDRLHPHVDPSLKKIAHTYLLNERHEDVLQTTALVNEALMKLIEEKKIEWEDRKHFYAFVAKRMHQVLLNSARSRRAAKRDFGRRVGITDAINEPKERSEHLIMLEAALVKLEQEFPDRLKVIELKFFGGLSFEDIGNDLGVATRTAQRKWEFAKAWLVREMTNAETS